MKLPSISKLPYCIKHLPGYDRRNWLRVAQIDAWTEFLEPLKECSVLEISPSWNSYWRSLGFRSYEAVSYPEFDICRQALERQFDIVIADQVLEHVPASVEAVRNIRRMTRHHALIATPFLFRVHGRPGDFCRWTDAGLRQLMADGGFDSVTVSSWGNKACARAHIGGAVRDYGFWRDMRNDPEYPMMVWAIGEV